MLLCMKDPSYILSKYNIVKDVNKITLGPHPSKKNAVESVIASLYIYKRVCSFLNIKHSFSYKTFYFKELETHNY